ncbi:hypothetical protein [Alkaliphilus crotonatoxidans]
MEIKKSPLVKILLLERGEFMRKLKYFIVVIVIIGLFLGAGKPLYYFRSLALMYPYSLYHHQKSLLREKDLSVSLPAGFEFKDESWYPFVMTFTDSQGLSEYTGKDLSYTILYNFPHFDLKQGGSAYYQPDSPFYSSFYGAYLIENHEPAGEPYGYQNKKVNVDEIKLLPKYDQLELVLPSLGCPKEKRLFEVTIDTLQEGVSVAGIDGFTKIDATILTNSPLHQYKGHQQGYLQYGLPPQDWQGEDFPLISLKGQVYVKYFEAKQVTMVLYLMGREEDFIEKWDHEIFHFMVVDGFE